MTARSSVSEIHQIDRTSAELWSSGSGLAIAVHGLTREAKPLVDALGAGQPNHPLLAKGLEAKRHVRRLGHRRVDPRHVANVDLAKLLVVAGVLEHGTADEFDPLRTGPGGRQPPLWPVNRRR